MSGGHHPRGARRGIGDGHSLGTRSFDRACYKAAQVGIHFTFKRDWQAVQRLLPLIEQKLARFGARPHWGKVFTMDSALLRSRYERLPNFQALLRKYDPQSKFRNTFLQTYIG